MSGECSDDRVSSSDNEIDDVAVGIAISGYLSPQHGASSGCGQRNGLQNGG